MPTYWFEFVSELSEPFAIEMDLPDDAAARHKAYKVMAEASRSAGLAYHPNPGSIAIRVLGDQGQLIATLTPRMPD